MDAIYDLAPGPTGDVLLVMLPGAMHKPQDLIANGFVAALRERALPISVVIPDAHPGYYLDRDLEDRFAAASELRRECRPPQHVTAIAGGHDWATWRALWKLLLDQGLFAHRRDAQRNGRAGDQA